MILEEFKEQAGMMYETVREVFQDRLEQLDQYIAVYQEAGDLEGLTEEELQEILPTVTAQQKLTSKVVEKLNDTKTRDWFIEMVNSDLESNITEEDAEILLKAIEIQSRIDNIFEEKSSELVSYLSKDLGNKVVVN